MPIAHLGKFNKIDIDQEAKRAGIKFGEYTNGLTTQYGVMPNSNLSSKNRWTVSTMYTTQALTKKEANKFKDYLNKTHPCGSVYYTLGIGFFEKDGVKIHPNEKVTYCSKHNKLNSRCDFESEIEWINSNLRYWKAQKDNYRKIKGDSNDK